MKNTDNEDSGNYNVRHLRDTASILGGQAEAIRTLQREVLAMRNELSEIKEMIAMSRGGVKMLYAVGTAGAACGAGIASLFHWLMGAPK